MKELARETTNFGRTTTMYGFAPWPLAYLWVAAVFLPMLLIGQVAHTGNAKHWRDYDSFWKDWHAKYDRYKSKDGRHSLNSVSLPSEWPLARTNALCTCGFEVRNGTDDTDVLEAFQSHLDASEPGIIDLAFRAEI